MMSAARKMHAAQAPPPARPQEHQVELPILWLVPSATPAPALARMDRVRRNLRARREAHAYADLPLGAPFPWQVPPPPMPAARPAVKPLPVLRLPGTRLECQGEGICPVFRCRHNLALTVRRKGSIKVDGGGPGTTITHSATSVSEAVVERMVDAIVERAEQLGTLCSLDLADRGPASLEEVGRILGLKDEIVRMETNAALAKLREELDDDMVPDPSGASDRWEMVDG